MLTRERLSSIIDKNTTETMEMLYASVVWMYPSVEDGSNEQGFKERYDLTEHVIKSFFANSEAQRSPSETLVEFCRILKFDEDDIELAAQQTCWDLDVDYPTPDEVAVTAVFIWFAEIMRTKGDFDLEFKYLFYVLPSNLRGNSELKKAGVDYLAEKLRSGGNFFANLASFYRKVLARH